MFFYILIIICILIILLIFANIKTSIVNIRLSTEKFNGRYINKEYKFIISLYILGKLKIFKTTIDREKLENMRLKNKIKDLELDILRNRDKFNIETLRAIKKLKLKIDYLKLRIDIGTEDATTTAYITAVLSSVLGILLKRHLKNNSDKKFIVNPIFINKNLLNLELNCIFTIKVIHIIYIIYILIRKRRDDKNVRTSNRRAYGYSHE